MYKLVLNLLILIAVYFLLSFILNHFKENDNYDYVIKGDIEFFISEFGTFYNDKTDTYMYKIEATNNFNFIINGEFDKKTKIIKEIKYYKDDKYECILPIFIDLNVYSEVICHDGNSMNYYYNIDNIPDTLKQFHDDLIKDETNDITEIDNITINTNNLIEQHYIVIENYKGFYSISSDFNSILYDVTIYDNDIYNQNLAVVVDNNYISADYNEDYGFNEFNVVDFQKLKTTTIKSNYKISFDSYIQGVVDNKIYIFDNDNKKQYEVDIAKEAVNLTGDVIRYYNNGWQTMTLTQALDGLEFKLENDYTKEGYDLVKESKGIYYLFKKEEDKYKVYVEVDETINYLFEVRSIDDIIIVDEYIYYIEDDYIKVFNISFGVKEVIQYDELNYNDNLKFNIYVR